MCVRSLTASRSWASGSGRRPGPGRRCTTPRWSLFTRQGFDGTTVEEIADACEVSPRTFFRYFPTKEDVLFGDSEARRERLLAVLADQPADDAAVRGAHRRDAGAGARLPRRPRRARRPVEDRRRASPQLQAYKAEHQHGWEAAVVERARAPSGSAGDPGRPRRSCSCSPRSRPRRCGCRSTQWIADAAGPDLDVVLDDAFARLASGFDSTTPGRSRPVHSTDGKRVRDGGHEGEERGAEGEGQGQGRGR